jgi:hypothetical protein
VQCDAHSYCITVTVYHTVLVLLYTPHITQGYSGCTAALPWALALLVVIMVEPYGHAGAVRAYLELTKRNNYSKYW